MPFKTVYLCEDGQNGVRTRNVRMVYMRLSWTQACEGT